MSINVIQDGNAFWLMSQDFENAELLIVYDHLVKDDSDIKGAKEARELFIKQFPEYGDFNNV
jgi:hypothetical protein